MNFVEIIPLVRLPRLLEVFDYQIPEELKGALRVGVPVLILFRGKRVTGIVTKIKSESAFAKMPIQAVLDEAPLLDEDTLHLLCTFAKNAFVSPGLFLRYALPGIPHQKKSREAQFLRAPAARQSTPSVAAIRFDDSKTLKDQLTTMVKTAHDTKQSLLILFPIQEHAVAFVTFLKSQNFSAVLTLPTDALTRIYALWHSFKKGDTRVVVGTRNALFFPMPMGGQYVLVDEVADEWKQSDMNPRIDARVLLPVLAAHHKASVFTLTSQYGLQREAPGRTLIDARVHEPLTPRIVKTIPGDPFTPALFEIMEGAQRAFFFVHRKGDAALLRCKDCGYTALCSQCELSLAVHQTFLRCTACGTQTPSPLTCPSCNGAEFARYGVGTDRISELAAAQFPECEIMVTTSAFLHQWPLFESPPAFDVMAVIECDTMLHRPDFRSQEKLARIMNRLRQLAAETKARFLIQTQFPDLPVWRVGGPGEETWLKAELEERNALHYPPSWRMVKLLFQHENQTETKVQAAKIHTELVEKMPEGVECIGPYAAMPPKVRGKYHELLLLRFAPELFSRIQPFLFALPDTVVIDLDPNDILR